MNRTARWIVFALGAAGLLVLLGFALVRMPEFGGARHLYRDATVVLSLRQQSPNVVSSINFDQRGLDTFGEETILLASVLGAVTLLRPSKDERERKPRADGRVFKAAVFECGEHVLRVHERPEIAVIAGVVSEEMSERGLRMRPGRHGHRRIFLRSLRPDGRRIDVRS